MILAPPLMAGAETAPVAGRIARGAHGALRLLGQGSLLWMLFLVGSRLVEAVHVPMPGNLVGMLLLLLLLRLGIVRVDQVQELATVLLRHLTFFFVPLAVGLMTWTGLLGPTGLVLGASLIGSILVALPVAGLAARQAAAWAGEPRVD